MKTRTITGVLLFLFLAPFIIFGGYIMAILAFVLLALSTYEFLDVKRKAKQKNIPIYIYVISFIFSYLLVFDIPLFEAHSFDYSSGLLTSYSMNLLWIILFLAVLLTCSVFDKRFEIVDAFYSFATIIYLSLGIKGLLYIRSIGGIENIKEGLLLICYVFIVTCFTDMFAYFGGMTCYKVLKNKVHKLNERISPKKTIEGTIVGTIFGTGFGVLFALLFLKTTTLSYHWSMYLLLSFLLSIFGQIGDLILSANKRHFAIKDYSNLLPGHGGILDRFDSLLLNCMITAIFISVVSYIL